MEEQGKEVIKSNFSFYLLFVWAEEEDLNKQNTFWPPDPLRLVLMLLFLRNIFASALSPMTQLSPEDRVNLMPCYCYKEYFFVIKNTFLLLRGQSWSAEILFNRCSVICANYLRATIFFFIDKNSSLSKIALIFDSALSRTPLVKKKCEYLREFASVAQSLE